MVVKVSPVLRRHQEGKVGEVIMLNILQEVTPAPGGSFFDTYRGNLTVFNTYIIS